MNPLTLFSSADSLPQVQCFDLPADPNFDGIWDYQWCTEMQV